MADLKDFSVKVKNYKCFGEEPQGFDRIMPFNIIVGKNNSGKSTLLDIISQATRIKNHHPIDFRKGNTDSTLIFSLPLTLDEIKNILNHQSYRGPGYHPLNLSIFEKRTISWSEEKDERAKKFVSLALLKHNSNLFECVQNPNERDKIINAILNKKANSLKGFHFHKVYSERDILPEGENKLSEYIDDIILQGNGVGITNIIHNIISSINYESSIIELDFLSKLNDIIYPDSHFTDIVTQKLENDKWEIFLEEESKGRIALSKSGSGLKTIFIILVYLQVFPKIIRNRKYIPEKEIYAFEELENNMHPALLRRLLAYLVEQQKKHGYNFFLTTHSNVAIDFFSKNIDAQIIHVEHNKKEARCHTVKTYYERNSVLDDLDVRASDLLQSNCIIWVEGPSDRIYMNKWIELFSNDQLKEGLDYQCVFYGGRLLSHFESIDPSISQSKIPLLRINRNSVILIDSDRRKQGAHLNKTKRRIISEVESVGGFAWITKGKEIENYIPAAAIDRILGSKSSRQVGQFKDFFDHLDSINKGDGKKYRAKKPQLAELITSNLKKEDLDGLMDIEEKMKQVCNLIWKWNNPDQSEIPANRTQE